MISWRRPPDPHPLHTLVPARNDLAAPDLEVQRPAPAPTGVELLSGGEADPDVVDRDVVARRRLRAITLPEVLDLEIGWRLATREVDQRLVDGHAYIRSCGADAGVTPDRALVGRSGPTLEGARWASGENVSYPPRRAPRLPAGPSGLTRWLRILAMSPLLSLTAESHGGFWRLLQREVADQLDWLGDA
jgi:hypothetical protein